MTVSSFAGCRLSVFAVGAGVGYEHEAAVVRAVFERGWPSVHPMIYPLMYPFLYPSCTLL